MFAIGEAETKVAYSKVSLPKEYNLRKKDRKIMGVWVGDYCLYISDELSALKAKADHINKIVAITVNPDSQIPVPPRLNHFKVKIQGCISTIELKFSES